MSCAPAIGIAGEARRARRCLPLSAVVCVLRLPGRLVLPETPASASSPDVIRSPPSRYPQHPPQRRSRPVGPPLKGFMPARCICPSRLAVAGSLLVPVPASLRPRPGVAWSCRCLFTLTVGATERRRASLADSVPSAPADPAPVPQASCGPVTGCDETPNRTPNTGWQRLPPLL